MHPGVQISYSHANLPDKRKPLQAIYNDFETRKKQIKNFLNDLKKKSHNPLALALSTLTYFLTKRRYKQLPTTNPAPSNVRREGNDPKARRSMRIE